MNILYFHQYFKTPSMSGGTRSYEMARRLAEAGDEVHVVTSWTDKSTSDKVFITNEEGVVVHWIPIYYSNKMRFNERIYAFIKYALMSIKVSIKIKSDLVIATSTPLTIAIPGIIISKVKRIPMVFEVRDLWPELPIAMGVLRSPVAKYFAKLLERIAYKNSEVVIALSPGMKEGVIKTGYPSERVAVIPNSSDVQLFMKSNHVKTKLLNLLPEDPFILYAGTFGIINGVSYMVNLAGELNKIGSNVKIVLIGDGFEYDKIIKEAENSGLLNKNIFIYSSITKLQLVNVIRRSAMCSALFIDKKEMRANSANKFFDGLAAGKPLLINYGGWMHDLVIEKKLGISSWNKNIEDVAVEINSFINNDLLVNEVEKNVLRIASDQFSRDLHGKHFKEVLEVVKSKNGVLASAISEVFYD